MEKKETKESNYLAPCVKVIDLTAESVLCTSDYVGTERMSERDSEW